MVGVSSKPISFDPLSPDEGVVLASLASGADRREIARHLHCTMGDVDHHIADVWRKFLRLNNIHRRRWRGGASGEAVDTGAVDTVGRGWVD